MKKVLLLFYCLALAATVMAQQTVVSGIVKDENGSPLPAASILVKGTSTGTSADGEGRYSITAPEDGVLVFSFIGYASQEENIGNRTSIDINLTPDLNTLGEVVVVGYGTQKRSDVTGALSSVSAKDFEGQPVTRMDQALQGRVSGVQVTNAGGAPGGAVRIRVRGFNSIVGENDPLYVIDGFVGADFTNINPNDIASIDVLKDASATAIYGSRGANGVVIITTNSGKKGGMQVDFGARYYSSQVIKKQSLLSPLDFATTANDRATALGTAAPFTNDQIESIRKNGGTDWQNEIFRRAPGKEYQLTLSGGNDKTNYLISGNMLDQKGIINNSGYKRYSIRTNINSQISEKFSIRLNFTGTRRENLNTDGTQQRSSALAQALAWAPTTPVRTTDGQYTLTDFSSIGANPVAITNENEYRAINTNANILTGLRYEFIPGLSFDVQLGLNYLNSQGLAFQGFPASRTFATAGRSSNENITLQNTNTLNYKRVINNVHRIEVTAVLEEQKFTATGFSANVSNLKYPSQGYNNIALAETNIVGSGYSGWSLLSQLGRVNYAFKERYLLTAAVRRDGSSKFTNRNKYSVFPSVGLGWKISEETFMKNITPISNLKLRASWGLTGNQAVGPYQTLSLYESNTDDAGVVFNGGNGGKVITSGILLGNPGNLDLKWETTEQANVGLEVGLLAGRVNLAVDYFSKKTRDVLLYRPLPGFIGGYKILSNIGEIENKGWDIALNVTPVQTKSFQWNSSLNYSVLKNKLVSAVVDTLPLSSTPNSPSVLIVGQRLNSFWGYKYLGTFKADEATEAAKYGAKSGDAHYEDYNGDGVINDKDYQIIGNSLPKVSLGWNNTFTFKNLSLNLFFQGLFGFDKLNYTYAAGMVGSTDARQITYPDIKDRYIPGANETSNIPAFSNTDANQYMNSSRFVEKGDFIRLKNISLGYSIPKSTLRNVVGIKLFISATNLLTITSYKGIDPESNSVSTSGTTWDGVGTDVQSGVDYASYPNAKTYTAGINFTF